MQTKKSLSPEEAVEEYFDMLIKSRFIEMFGHIGLNEKNLPVMSLGDICSMITDGSHYSPIDEPGEPYPMLSVKDLSDGAFDYHNCKYIGQKAYDKLVKEGCKPLRNDVLIAKDGSVFQKSMVVSDEKDQVILSSIAILRPDLDIIDPIYLNQCLMSDYIKEDVIRNYTTGTAIRRIILKNLTKLQLAVPEIQYQNQFADFVKQVDKSKAICKQIFQSFDNLVKSRFIEMFGSPDNNRYDLPVETLNQLTMGKLTYGIAASAIDYDGKTRYIRITDIDEDGNLNDDYKSPDEYDEKYLLNDGDILFARSGATVGKTFQYSSKYGQALYAGYLIRSIPDVNKILPKYLLYATKSAYYNKCIEKLRRGATQPNINAQQYGSLEFLVPPLDQQESFVNFVQQVDKSKFEVVQSLLKLKDSMKSSQ